MRCISVISRCAALYRNERLAPLGLNGCQHTYILCLCRNPGISQEELARRVYINKSNVARQVAQLVQAGFVTRQASETDKRVMLVTPTQKAYDVCPIIREALKEWNAYMAEGFCAEESARMDELLPEMMARATAYADGRTDVDGFFE
ncbi:MAG: MarR family transcriptional regulator [Clostridia bacterium]